LAPATPEAENFQQMEPQFCNKKSTATKKAPKITSFVCIDHPPETAKRMAQKTEAIHDFQLSSRFFFRCKPGLMQN
jgi:hypothetical protein